MFTRRFNSSVADMFQPPTFCELAYCFYQKEQMDSMPETNYYMVETDSQSESLFLETIPNEIIAKIFRFLDQKSLARCQPVCKQFYNVATYLPLDFESISHKFGELEKYINIELNNIELNNARFFSKDLQEEANSIKKIMKVLTAFKAQCLFSINQAQNDAKKVQEVIGKINKIQQRCHYKLEEL